MIAPDPFDTLFQFQEALDALRASSWLERSPSGSGAYPPLNVFRTGDDVVIRHPSPRAPGRPIRSRHKPAGCDRCRSRQSGVSRWHPGAVPATRRKRQATHDCNRVKEATMVQGLKVQEKKEVVSKEEKTVPARYYMPSTDITESDDALTVVMEMPGVERNQVQVHVENDVLRVEGQIDFGKYEGMEPLYTEYNVGHFARAFTLSGTIDQQQISAQLTDGVLILTLKKMQEAKPRRIEIK
jgi:HSP20 family protein